MSTTTQTDAEKNGIESKEVVKTKPVKEVPKQEPEVRPEMDFTKSHKERIMLFVLSRKTREFVRIDGFLKALFPQRPNEKPGWNNQGNMKKLRQDLRELRAERKLEFSNNNFELLGAHFWRTDDPERKTRYHDGTDTVIEARLP
jgi:hypothetical protein